MQFRELQKYGVDQVYRQTQENFAKIAKEYDKAYKAIKNEISGVYSKFLAGVPKEDFYRETLKFDRLKKLERAISREYVKLYNTVGRNLKNNSSMAMANNFYFQQYATNWLSPYSFTIIPENVVEFSVTSRADLLKSIKSKTLKDQLSRITPRSGITLSKLVSDNRAKAVNKTLSTVTQGLIRGTSVQELGRDLRKIEAFSKSAAERIIRTETHRNMEAGGYIQWETAKAKGVDGVRILVAVKDDRVREQSVQVDGERDTGKGFLYPDGSRYFVPGNTGNPAWDINDRETVIYEIDGQSPEIERGRNPVTGKNEVIKATSFDDWAKSHDLTHNVYGQIIKKG